MGTIRRRAGFNDAKETAKLSAKLDPNALKLSCALPCVSLPGGNHVILAGHADNSIKVFNCNNGSIESSEVGHRAPVISLSISTDGRVLATGCADGSIGIWLIKLPTEKVTIGENLRETIAPIIRVDVNSIFNEGSTVANVIDPKVEDGPTTKMSLLGPISLLRGHGESISSLEVNTNLDLLVAVSPSAGTSFYSVMKGTMNRVIPELRGSLCAISDEGFIAVWEESTNALKVASINGTIISLTSLVDISPDLTCLLVSRDGYHLLVGSVAKEGKVTVAIFELLSLELLTSWHLNSDSDISHMSLTAENTNLLVATREGSLTVITNPELAVRSLENMLQAGWSSVV